MPRTPPSPEEIRALVFDYDGTLAKSMGSKALAFSDSVIAFARRTYQDWQPAAHDRATAETLYLSTGGKNRHVQLNMALAGFSLPPVGEDDEEKRKEWSDLFDSLCTPAPLIDGVEAVLRTLKERSLRLFVSSSVPQKPLDKALESHPSIAGLFDEVLGTREGNFRKGPAHLQYLAEKFRILIGQMVFVGDALEDLETTRAAGGYAVIIPSSDMPDAAQERLREADPDLLLGRFRDLPGALSLRGVE